MSKGSSLPVIGWFDDPIKKSINSIFSDINTSVEAVDLFKKYRGVQFEWIRENLNKVKVLGMAEPLKLTQIYHPARVSTTIHRRLYDTEWQAIQESISDQGTYLRGSSGKSVPADEFIDKKTRVVILGGPGSGKTTLLRYIAYAYADKPTFEKTKLKKSKLPFFIRLPEFAEQSKDIETYIAQNLIKKTDKYAKAFLRRVFKHGLAIVFCDSLDEVPPEHKSHMLTALRQFSQDYPNTSMIISCRIADYEAILEDFNEVELTRLTDNAIKKIITAWFSDRPSQAKDLIRHLRQDKGTYALTQTPLLLSLLCIQFGHDLTLPRRKAELYKRCFDALLRDWDASRGFRRSSSYELMSDDRKERLFEHVAAHFFDKEPKYVFSDQELYREIGKYGDRFGLNRYDAPGIAKEIESHHGVLERCSANSYVFSHPSFQEFFVARHAVSRRRDMDILRAHYKDEDWANVIEFILALREEPERLVEFLVRSSSVERITKSYPAIGQRTKTLCLLYRCLSAGAAVPRSARRAAFSHIVDTQIEMAVIYSQGGVFPFAVLMRDGVRHAYYYVKKRDTLAKALQPLRLLANAVYNSPNEDYSGIAIEKAKTILSREQDFIEDSALALCLATPVANQLPKELRKIVMEIREEAGHKRIDFLAQSMDESLKFLPGPEE